MMQDSSYDAAKYAVDSDAGKYAANTATTTATTTATSYVANQTDGIGFQKRYLLTIPAVIKYVEMGASLVASICMAFNYFVSEKGWASFVSSTALITAIIWFIFYLFNIVSKFHPVMILVELIYYAVIVVLYFIAWVVAIDISVRYSNGESYAAYAVFATFAMIAFAVDCFFQFRKWREARSQPPREVVATQQTTVTTTTTSSSHYEGAPPNYAETTEY